MSQDTNPETPPEANQSGGIWSSWTNREILGLFFLVLVGNQVCQAFIYQVVPSTLLAVGGGAILGTFLPLVVVSRLRGLQVRRDFLLDLPPPPVLMAACLVAVASLVPLSLLAELSARLAPADERTLALFNENLPRGTGETVMAYVAVVVLGPLAEELTFRTLLHRFSSRMWGPLRASAVSALFFGIIHGQPWLLFGLVGVGLVLALVLETTGSVTACWLTHAVHNAISLTMLLNQGGMATHRASPGPAYYIIAAGSLAVLAVLARYLLAYRRARLGAQI